MSTVKILFLGEVIGRAGVYTVKTMLPQVKKEYDIDLTIANGDGTTGGFGLGKGHAIYLRKIGVDVITGGDCCYFKKDIVAHLARAPYMVRPANYPFGNPGRGWTVATARNGQRIGVINVLGQAGFSRVHLSNPFLLLEQLVEKVRLEAPIILVDFHAAVTAEKLTMFHYLAGKVSAVLGTHVRTLSADHAVLPGGTAVITHSGRTGSLDSVAGLEKSIEIRKFLTQLHELSQEAWGELELQGVVVEVAADGTATGITSLRIPCADPPGHDDD